MAGSDAEAARESLMAEIRARHPRFVEAVVADAQVTARYRGERSEFRSAVDTLIQVLRLTWQTDAFLAQILYRAKARLQALGVPLLPRIAHRLAMQTGQVSIGDPVVVAPGLYLLHGQVVIDGVTEVAPGVTIAPFVTIGLRGSEIKGPTVGGDVHIGSGAKLLGPIEVGAGAQIGANAVVLEDVAEGATAVGAPAKTPGKLGPIEAGATTSDRGA